MQYYSNWMGAAASNKAAQLEGILGKNIEAIAGAKDKMTELENDNEALANENEELR